MESYISVLKTDFMSFEGAVLLEHQQSLLSDMINHLTVNKEYLVRTKEMSETVRTILILSFVDISQDVFGMLLGIYLTGILGLTIFVFSLIKLFYDIYTIYLVSVEDAYLKKEIPGPFDLAIMTGDFIFDFFILFVFGAIANAAIIVDNQLDFGPDFLGI